MSVFKWCMAWALLSAFSAWAKPGVLLFPSLGSPYQITIEGRVLKEMPSSGSSAWSRNLRRLLAPNWEGAEVKVSMGDQHARVTSQGDGAFIAVFSAPEGKPFSSGRHEVEARVEGAMSTTTVEVLPKDTAFLLISDFDDTLVHSHVVNKAQFVQTALGEDVETQAVVSGMSAFYRCLAKKRKVGFALVSGSPVQYLYRVQSLLKKHGFPSFGLYLRDLSPSTLSDYKQPRIRELLKQFPHRVILVGDSGEKDPEIYEQMRQEFPGRIARIYIRDAGNADDKTRFKDMMLFQKPEDAVRDAVAHGLQKEACESFNTGAAQ